MTIKLCDCIGGCRKAAPQGYPDKPMGVYPGEICQLETIKPKVGDIRKDPAEGSTAYYAEDGHWHPTGENMTDTTNSWWCAFGVHDWGKWEQKEFIWNDIHGEKTIQVTRQVRECKRCGKRKVDTL